MRFYLPALILLVSLPLTGHAAGFATQPLFLSKTPVTEGETVFIHAVVANDAADTFKGDVIFKDTDTKIGSVSVSIAPGGANAVSVSWSPVAGSHKVVAELTRGDATVVESQSQTFSVGVKPKPVTPNTQGAAVESSQQLQNSIEQYSPSAAQVAQPVFTTLDGARAATAHALDNGIEWAKQKGGASNPGEVLGEATKDTSPSGITNTVWRVLATIVYWILSALLFVVSSAGIFYPAFAILFFYVLWRTFKRFRRPRY